MTYRTLKGCTQWWISEVWVSKVASKTTGEEEEEDDDDDHDHDDDDDDDNNNNNQKRMVSLSKNVPSHKCFFSWFWIQPRAKHRSAGDQSSCQSCHEIRSETKVPLKLFLKKKNMVSISPIKSHSLGIHVQTPGLFRSPSFSSSGTWRFKPGNQVKSPSEMERFDRWYGDKWRIWIILLAAFLPSIWDGVWFHCQYFGRKFSPYPIGKAQPSFSFVWSLMQKWYRTPGEDNIKRPTWKYTSFGIFWGMTPATF